MKISTFFQVKPEFWAKKKHNLILDSENEKKKWIKHDFQCNWLLKVLSYVWVALKPEGWNKTTTSPRYSRPPKIIHHDLLFHHRFLKYPPLTNFLTTSESNYRHFDDALQIWKRWVSHSNYSITESLFITTFNLIFNLLEYFLLSHSTLAYLFVCSLKLLWAFS